MPSSNPNPTPTPMQPKKSKVGTIVIVIGIILVILVAVAYALTRNSAVPATNSDTSLQLNDVPSQTAGTPASATATNYTTSTPTISALTLVNLETFPVQYQARVSFDLPDSCTTADSSISKSANVFTIVVTGSRPTGAVCAQAIVPSQQTVNIPTAGLAAGTYTVKAGKFSKTFKIAATNETTFTSDK
ncbi:MAG: hypothetical protein JWM20_509 [Patescibacteria group bacterium]|nr:hypothetical protein [Patescibacteria group bacterium]